MANPLLTTRRWPFSALFAFMLAVVLVLPAVAVTTVSAQDADAEATPMVDQAARIVAIHAVPAADAIDLYVNDEERVVGLEFGQATDLFEIEGDNFDLQIVASGEDADEPLLEGTQTIEPGQTYALVILGTPEELLIASYAFEITDGMNGDQVSEAAALLLAVHAAEGADAIDVGVVGEDALITELGVNEGETVGVGAGDYEMDVRESETGDTLVSVPEISLEAGDGFVLVVTFDQDDALTAIGVVVPDVTDQGPDQAGATNGAQGGQNGDDGTPSAVG